MHVKRRYVKLASIGAAALLAAPPARAELLYPGRVDSARLSPAGTVAAYGIGASVHLATRRAEGWSLRTIRFPADVEVDGVAGRYVLGRARDGSRLALWDGTRLRFFRRDSVSALFGPAGLALDGDGRPVVAYAVWFPSQRTFLRLARMDATGRITVRAVTKEGFPPSRTLAAAAPVVLRSGAVRVVETFLPAAIDWGLTGWGKLLFSSALGVPTGGVVARASGTTVYAAWTMLFPGVAPPGVALAVHGRVVRSGVVSEDAVLGGLALPRGRPELAVNRCLPAAAFGEADDGGGLCGALVSGSGVDGVVADYTALEDRRALLLDSERGLEWFALPAAPAVRVQLDSGLAGRVDGATGGSVTVYEERPGEPRAAIGTVALAADGTFSVPAAPASPRAVAYRAVYVDPATGVPFAALLGPPAAARAR